ncbi:hypothetical protein [uncultured Lactobacillus sp.]|uniref:hypothetical protein n=1 Tax=uncultured Lactobacillus sp. TaxID=153152 RepID=UPI0025CF7205|nr:hypothetical protein [uncultured Lactobacillus sp.]
MTEMLAHKFDLVAANLIKLKPLIKELGQYNKLLVAKASIAVCQKNKAAALERVYLFQKSEINHLANNLRSEIDDFYRLIKQANCFFNKMNYYLVNIVNEVAIMIRKVKFGIFACIVAAGLFLFYYWASNDYIPDVAQYQVNQIIRKHDTREINQVATNRKTAKFLHSLKTSDRCQKISKLQGGTEECCYYVASIKNKPVGIYMQKKSNSFWNWKIKNIACFD